MSRTQSRILITIIFLMCVKYSKASINPGDLVVVGFNASNSDQIALLATTNIAAGDIFKVTDKGWTSGNSFYPGEGVLTWTGGAIAHGTIIYIDMSNLANFTQSGSFDLAAGGDQIFIYSGADAAPSFIYAINFNASTWAANATNGNTSALPSSLTNGQTAISLVNKSSYVYGQYIDLSNTSQFFTELGNYNSWKGSIINYTLSTELHIGSTTKLGPGDILLIAYNATSSLKEFAFVTLKSLNQGTQIKITDRGWHSGTGFYANEGTVVYTVPTGGIVAGGIIQYPGSIGNNFYQTGSFALASNGDQLIAYQGGESSPDFLYGLNTQSNWVTNGGSINSNTSQAPPISPPIGDATVLRTTSNSSNFIYTGITQGTVNALETAISNFTDYYTYSSTAANIPATINNFIIEYLPITSVPTNLSGDQNFIATWTTLAPETNAANLITRSYTDVRLDVQYFDGLGRPIQTVHKESTMITGGSTVNDIVNFIEYDEFGREVNKHLPYVSTGSDGSYKPTAFTAQQTFYNGSTSPIIGQGENIFYGITQFEASPLNRVLKTMAPGNSWAGAGRGVSMQYMINTASDDIRIWDVANSTTPGNFGSYSSANVYPPGELFKSVTTNEDGKQVIEFKDKEGKVILKKVQLTATADNGEGRNHEGWLCTYYIYDELNNLRCVIQPEAVKKMSDPLNTNWDVSAYQTEQCFRYEYDQRNRMIMKKVPGAGTVYMVYDNRDRLVMTQDANMRNPPLGGQVSWHVIKYDALNRPVETGLWENNTAFTTHLTNASSSDSYPTTSGTYDIMTITQYDDYSNLPVGLSSYLNTWNSHFSTDHNNWPYPQAPVVSNATKGMVTWTSTRILGSNDFIHAVSYYDDKGRVIQVQSTNITGGTDVATTQYTWAGQSYITVQKQHNASGTGHQIVIVTKNIYDPTNRLSSIQKKQSYTSPAVNIAMENDFKTVAELEYDAMGQVKKKKLAPGYIPSYGGVGEAGLEGLTYEYNIRGWILGMNRSYAKDANNNNYFGFDIGYDKTNNGIINNQTYSTAQYNGNIAGMVWKSKGDGEKRKYDFEYDAANRLLKADFNQYTSNTFNKTAGVDFSVQMGDPLASTPIPAYDANGNIIKMQQWGLKLNSSEKIDDLSYAYLPGSNKLRKVVDLIVADNKLGDFTDRSTGTYDYAYDDNGNMITDLNKSIDEICGITACEPGITYNHLNLPQKIIVTQSPGSNDLKGKIEYLYDAAGNKLKKTVTESGQPKTTLYLGGAVYENDVLQFISHEEGRIRFKPAEGTHPATLQYDYFIKDHLGNVRVVLTEEHQQDKYPVASLEQSKIATEKLYYDIQDGNLADKIEATGIPDYINDNGIGNNPSDPTFEATNSARLYKLNSNTAKTGFGIALKVMAGDKIDVFGKSYYFNSFNPNDNSPLELIDILNAFLGGPAALGTSHGITGASINNPINLPGINSMITQQETQSAASNKPRAFINVIFFDEQFKSYVGGFRISMVGSNNVLKDHYSELQNIVASKSGYVYIYCSNESPVDVFFDNLQVVHTRGALLEETHYYPFGLTMTGISSKAAGVLENKKQKFQGQEFASKEFSDGSGLEMYEFKWRMHDPQTGRFWQVDPLSEKYVYNSTYAFSENKVTSHYELEGLESASMHFPSSVSAAERDAAFNAMASEHKKAAIGTAIAGAAVAAIVYPPSIQYTAPVAASILFGVPTPGAPAAVVTSAATAIDDVVSMADKARVLTAGGEIGLMEGAANLAVDAKTGFFNISLQAGTETGVITGEINISKNAIGFSNIEITNAKGGLGSIGQQNSIGAESFLKLQKELTDLSKAGGFNKGTVEFSRLRPPGSPLPDTDTRTITLFENTVNQ